MPETADTQTPRWLRLIGLAAGPIAAIALLLLPSPAGLTDPGLAVLAVAAIMAIWWITEALPIPVTSLLPLVLFPMLGVMPMAEASAPYAHPLVFLFLGGFVIALAVERSGLHRRIALRVILLVGSGPSRLVLGFMIATAALSMWVSNTATVLLMLPIALAVIDRMREQCDERVLRHFSLALMLGLAYSASIGGIATLVGTPPNIVLAGVLARLYPDAPPIGFLQWMLFGLPVAVLFLPICWLLLVRVLPFSRLSREHAHRATGNMNDSTGHTRGVEGNPGVVDRHLKNPDGRAPIREALAALGPMSRSEIRVLVVFVLTAAAWIFRTPIDLGSVQVPGLTILIPALDDGTIAMSAAMMLFLLPAGDGTQLLSWKSIERGIPWGVLLLFGGGFALAEGMRQSGVTLFLGSGLAALHGVPLWLLLLVVCTLLTFLTEITSNTATANILLPVLASAAVTLGHNPLLLMVPAALNTSFAFMLPVATPPNAIVFSSGHVSIRQMALTGLTLNIVGILLVTCMMYLLGFSVFGIDPLHIPSWAR